MFVLVFFTSYSTVVHSFSIAPIATFPCRKRTEVRCCRSVQLSMLLNNVAGVSEIIYVICVVKHDFM